MTTYRLWPSTSGPGSQNSDSTDYTLGVEFYVTQSGCTLTQILFWASGTITGSDHACRLYTADTGSGSTLVTGSSKAFPSPLVAGWNTVTLNAPIALTANQRYRASVFFTTADGYTNTGSYWSSGAGSGGITSGPLVAPDATTATNSVQGSFVTADSYPTNQFQSSNYWVDVTIDDGGSGSDLGALAGSTPPISGALAGTVADLGALAGVVVPSVGALAGAVVDLGALAGSTTPAVGALTGTVTDPGALAGATPRLIGAIPGTVTVSGALAGSTPRLVGTLSDASVPVAYPLRAGAIVDNVARYRAGAIVDNVARYRAGAALPGNLLGLPAAQDLYPPTYAEAY